MSGRKEPRFLEKVSYHAAIWTGSSWAFLIALVLTLAWIISGPVYRFSTEWQLIMNTMSSISAFLMVFLLQRSQMKESLAMQVKLSEIIAALQGANNHLISAEDLSEEEILALHKYYHELAANIEKDQPESTEPLHTYAASGPNDTLLKLHNHIG